MSEIETLKSELIYWQRVIGDRMGADDRRFSDMVRDLKDVLACAPEAGEAVAWCQPMDCGKHTPRKFMIYFEDPDHGIMVFDNEAEARAAFERKNTSWNCYLFGTLPLDAAPPARSAATTVEPVVKAFCRHCHDEVSTIPCCEACGGEIEPHLIAPTASPEPATSKESLQVQSPEPDAVREAVKTACKTLYDLGNNTKEANYKVLSRDIHRVYSDLKAALASSAPVEGTCEDTKLLDALKDESWDLRCFDMPTGGGDADIGWRVIGHWQAKPQERIVGEAFHDDPRAAIRDAMTRNDRGGEAQ